MADILGIGVDIVDIGRIAELREKHGERFHRIIFTERETSYCLALPNPDESLAARFAAKEAVMKALGTGWTDRVTFTGIEIGRLESGRPTVELRGSTAEQARELGAGRILASLSHSRGSAIAYVMIEKDKSGHEAE